MEGAGLYVLKLTASGEHPPLRPWCDSSFFLLVHKIVDRYEKRVIIHIVLLEIVQLIHGSYNNDFVYSLYNIKI